MTRDDILNAAATIFSEKGFHGASMQDIAEAVKLQKSSLYHHVSSKQEILLALLDKALDLLIERIGKVADMPLSPEQKLRLSMVTYLETLLEHKDLAAILLLEHRSLDTDLRARHIPRRDRFEELWKEMIKEGIDEHVFNCHDPGFVTRSLLGMLNWTITWYRPDGPLNPAAIAKQYADLAILGIMSNSQPQ
ncbi:MAG: TetR/AcrR family transcriptional regulator [Chloroflexi bacterium]|nr:TetR/AcrR family transcriptional regulator [Chloroflexota bacterium]